MNVKALTFLTSALISTQVIAATDEIIVTGTYSPVSANQLTSSVSIIGHDELVALSSHSLVDALRQVPAIWVDEQGGPGGLTGISLRGAESNHTLVLLDGVQLNDPTNTRGGAFDLNNINIDSIKRIEIIRGAQSSIYGSDALAGVIHIITVEPTEKNQNNATFAIGDDGYKTGSFTTSGTLNNLGYAFKLQSKDAGEPIAGSTAHNQEAVAKLNWKQEAHTFDFSYRYFDGERTNFPEQSGGLLFAQSRDLDVSNYTDQSAALGWQWQINDWWKSKTQASWFNRKEDLTSPGIVPFDAVPANGANTDFTRDEISWINTLGNEKTFWGNIGVETKKETGDSNGYLDVGVLFPTNFSLERRINSGFVNLNGYVVPDLLLQATVRRDDAEDIAAKNSTQIGARYQITSGLSWFINHGEGFKLPSFLALGHPLIGNPYLKPETAKTWDTGIEWAFDSGVFNISYFDNRYRDLIDFDNELFTNVNRARVDTSGVDTEIHWHTRDNKWQLGLHGSYTDVDAENPLLGRPQVKAGSTVAYTLNDCWQFNVNYLWVGERFATSRYTGDAVMETLDSYNRLDVGAKWKVTKEISVSANIENITDEDYVNDIGFPAIGRTGYVKASIDF